VGRSTVKDRRPRNSCKFAMCSRHEQLLHVIANEVQLLVASLVTSLVASLVTSVVASLVTSLVASLVTSLVASLVTSLVASLVTSLVTRQTVMGKRWTALLHFLCPLPASCTIYETQLPVTAVAVKC